MKDLTKLNASQLVQEHRRLDRLVDINRSELIAQGYGHETFPQAVQRSEKTGDALVTRFVANARALKNVVDEANRRKAYSGTLKAI